jgi:hypothetical protein
MAKQTSDETWQTQIFTELVPYLPESFLPEALDNIRAMTDLGRTRGMVRLAARLAELGRTDEALALVNDIQDAEGKAEALAELSPRLAQSGQLEVALVVVREIEVEYWQTQAIRALAPILLAGGYPEEAVAIVREIKHTVDREAAMLELILPLAASGYASIALVAAQEIEDEEHRLQTLAQLAWQLAELGSFKDAVATAEAIETIDEQVMVLAELMLYCPDNWKKAALQEVLTMVASLESGESRYEALSRLVPQLVTLPVEALTQIWLQTDQEGNLLHLLAQRTRQDLLSDLLALEPVIAKLGGTEAVGETFYAVLEVGRWWP